MKVVLRLGLEPSMPITDGSFTDSLQHPLARNVLLLTIDKERGYKTLEAFRPQVVKVKDVILIYPPWVSLSLKLTGD